MIALDSQPTDFVMVNIISPYDNPDVMLRPASLTFSPGDWNVPRTVMVTVAEDFDPDDETATVTHHVSSMDSNYEGATANSVVVNVADDDGEPATVSFGQADYTVIEGGTVTATVSLGDFPGRTVVIPITATPQGTTTVADYTVSAMSVTFGGDNMSKTFTVTATQDAEDDDGESVLLGFGPLLGAVSAGTTAEATVSITDDDDPLVAVTVSYEAAAYTVAEGDTVTVTVTLNLDPERTVVIPLTATAQGSTTATDYSVMPTSLTFNAGDTSQTISFRATDDSIDDDGESVLLGFGASLPEGVTAGATATVSVTDDDTAGVTVSDATVSVAEGGTNSYTIVLESEPSADVTVTINDPTDNTDVTAEPADLTFTSTDWNTAQTVTVSAAHDADATSETATVTHTVNSSDSNYQGATADSVTVTVTDDDQAGVMVSDSALGVAEGGSNSYTIVLESEPSADVTVTIIDPTDNTDVTAEPADLTFTSTDWNTAQTVTVSAAHDADATGETDGHTLERQQLPGRHGRQRDGHRDRRRSGRSHGLGFGAGRRGRRLRTATIVLESDSADVTVTINDPTDNTDVTAEPADLTFTSTDEHGADGHGERRA